MKSLFLRTTILASTAAPLFALAAMSPAFAQSGAPASGTSMDPPATGVSTGAATPTTADDGAVASNTGGLVDIVVTARRTNEQLQTTPVAVTALSNELLVTKQVAQVTDLARATPALSVGTGGTGPASIVYLAIRGQAQNSPNSFSDASIGIYIDGVYVARPLVGNLGFLDMASAEVLRGPQGTLFGRNTTGGALNLTTASPTDELEGYVKAGIGNYDMRVFEGVLNMPLSSEVAVRFAGRYDEHDGYFPNDLLGIRQGSVNGSYYGRGTLKWESAELPITLTISGDYNRYSDNGNASAVAAINPAGPLAALYGASQAGAPGFGGFVFAGSGPITQYINPEFATDAQRATLRSTDWRSTYGVNRTGRQDIDVPRNTTDAYSGTANLVVDLGAVTLKSITGYRHSKATSNLNLTGTPTAAGAFISVYNQHQFSEELQISGDLGGLQYTVGANYFREAGDESSDSAIFYALPGAGGPGTGGTFARAFADFVAKSVGLFAQANYNITDALRVTAGIRYTWDKRSINRHGIADWRVAEGNRLCVVGPNAGLTENVAPCNDPESAKFDYPAWTAGVDYKLTDDVFVYAKTSGASMSGGFNSRPVPAPFSSSFQPEDVRDIEGGFKGEFLDRRLRTNVAIFHAWQSGVQRIINTTFTNAQGQTALTQFVTNAGDAKAYGGEVEVTAVPWEGMTIDGSAAYLNARYKAGSRIENQIVNGQLIPVDRSGEPITQAPKWTWSVGATQVFELEAGKLSLHADYAYISSRYFDFFTTGDPAQAAAVAVANEASLIRGYGLLNAQVAFTFNDPEIEITAWAKNLSNTPWFTNVFNSYTGIGATVQFQGAPRTYGVSAAFRF